jgi:heme exporter protein A
MQTPAAENDGSPPLLRARALAGRRGERRLFEGLELSLRPGDVVWLRGRNGRGKTTLLRMLAGLSTPEAGTIELDGRPLQQAAAEGRRRLHYIAHANALKDDLSATEALRFLARIGGTRPSDEALQRALARLGVASRAAAPVRTLSQGQRRRVALARLALPDAPPLWLLDEPFDALDDRGIEVLNGLLTEHAGAGGATLLTSHQALSLREPVPRELRLDGYAPRAGEHR